MTRCKNIVSSDQLKKDVDSGNLAHYMFYTPDLDNDGHDTSIAYTSRWLRDFIEPLLVHPNMKDTLFLLTYDEDDFITWIPRAKQRTRREKQKGIFNGNKVYTLLLGAGIQPGSRDSSDYNHYSQLATLQKYWGLESLGQKDAYATPFDFERDDSISFDSDDVDEERQELLF